MSDLKERLHQIACCEGECRANRIEAWERIAAMQAKLDAVRPYLQHKHRCSRQTNLNYACDCGLAELQAALNGEGK